MRRSNFLLLFCALFCTTIIHAQSVAVNTDGSTANTSALLDVKSTGKGVLIPRMSKAQKNSIAVPATGLLVFQESPDSIGFHYYNGTSWLWMATTGQQDTAAWRTRGNAGTSAANHFIGTTDNAPISFRENNIWAGRFNRSLFNYYIGDSSGIVSTGNHNVGYGYRALQNNTIGYENLAMGSGALTANTSGSRSTAFGALALASQSYDAGFAYFSDNTAVGNAALYYNQPTSTSNGVKNVAIGNDALYFNTTGYENTAVGVSAMRNSTTGHANTALGRSAARLRTIGAYGTYLGYSAGFSDSAGNYNTAIGHNSFAYHGLVGSNYNTAVGAFSMFLDSIGVGNTSLGVSALRANKIGYSNTALGLNAGYYQLRYRNTFVGAYAGFGEGASGTFAGDSGFNNTGIGAYAMYRMANGSSNTAVGYNALYNDSSGINNTAVGRSVLVDVTTGSNNTAIGYLNDVGSGNLNNTTTVGARAFVTQDNSLVLGSISGINGATASTSVGIGTTAPTARLDVEGNFKLGTNGSVMTEIIRANVSFNIGSLAVGDVELATLTVTGAVSGSIVYVSPAIAMPDGITISYARVSAANTVEVKFVNAGTATINPPAMTFYICVIR